MSSTKGGVAWQQGNICLGSQSRLWAGQLLFVSVSQSEAILLSGNKIRAEKRLLWYQSQRFLPIWGLSSSGFQSTMAPASSAAFSCTDWLWSLSAVTQKEPENKRVEGQHSER